MGERKQSKTKQKIQNLYVKRPNLLALTAESNVILRTPAVQQS